MIKALLWAVMVVFVFSTVSITTVDYANAVPMDKVTICHYPPGNHDNPRTIEVNGNSLLPAHLEHGDTIGPCESDNEPESETAESESETAESESETAESESETAEPESETAEPESETAEPESETAEPESETAEPESETSEFITFEDKNNGGMNHWDTRPTFGVNHETRTEQVVENGFMFNNQYFTINDNHHTEFEEQEIFIGSTSSFAAKVYASNGLKVQEFLFGVPNVGEGHLAEMRVEVWYDKQGEIQDVKVIQPTEVIERTSLIVSHQKSKCLETDIEEECDVTVLSMRFLEPLKDNVMAIKAIDFKSRDQTTYLNDGFDISGDSLNEMPSQMIASSQRGEGLIQVTQMEKYSDFWIAQDGRIFEKNSFGSFKLVNQEFERFQDKSEPRDRMHSGFVGIIEQEKVRASGVFDASDIVSDLPESFSYDFPETGERIDGKVRQEMSFQEEMAQQLLDEITEQSRFY